VLSTLDTGTDAMTDPDTSLVRQDDVPASSARRRSWLPVAVAAIALALIAAGAGWWFFNSQETIPEWDRLPALDLAAPAGDAFSGDTPWVNLRLVTARPGEENVLRVQVTPRTRQATPVPRAAPPARITSLTARPHSADPASTEPLALQPDPETDGAFIASSRLDQAGWWQLSVEVEGAEDASEFHLLIPDPNLNGPRAIPDSQSSPEGEALFRRGLDALTTLRDVRFTQWIADGRGNAAVSAHAVTAGDGNTPPGFAYRAVGGMEAIIIGSTRWIRLPGDPRWEEQEGATVVLPSEWDKEYVGATGFTILGEETIDGERCQLLAFVVPELTEPRRQTVAWYLWWVGTETGYVRKEAMVSRLHYMLNAFGDFDVPIPLAPPNEPATPVAIGTPVP
jgi:hypothetical protein